MDIGLTAGLLIGTRWQNNAPIAEMSAPLENGMPLLRLSTGALSADKNADDVSSPQLNSPKMRRNSQPDN